jgi:CBS domain-containing protein
MIWLMELTRNLKLDEVARLKPTPPHAIAPDATIGDAVRLMRQKKVGCLLVCQDRHLVGIITERDLLTRVLATGRPLSDTVDKVMTADPRTVFAHDSVRRAMIRMQKGGYRHLPVVDEAGRPVGILSIKRVIHYLAAQFSAAVYNQPPNPDAFPNQRGGA